MDDIWHQMLKESYWFVVWGALVAIAFAPTFLKAKCPKCGKRKLTTVDLEQKNLKKIPGYDAQSFLVFYTCGACDNRFYKDKSGPFQDAADTKWDPVYAPIETSLLDSSKLM